MNTLIVMPTPGTFFHSSRPVAEKAFPDVNVVIVIGNHHPIKEEDEMWNNKRVNDASAFIEFKGQWRQNRRYLFNY